MPSLRRRLRNRGPRRYRHARCLVVMMLAAGLGVALTAVGADAAARSASSSAGGSTSTTAAAVALGSLVLTQPVPDLTAAPAGPTNGPLSVSEFASQSSEPARAEQQFNALADKAGFGAFIRLWTDRAADPGAGANDLAVLLFRIGDAASAQSFAAGLNQPFDQAAGSTAFAVPSVPGARGYSVSVTTPVPATERVVVFRAGRYVSMIELASARAATNPTPLTPTQAVAISYLQLSQLRAGDPGNAGAEASPVPSRHPSPTRVETSPPATSSTGPVLAVVAGALVAGLVAVLLVGRRRRAVTDPATAGGPRPAADPWAPGGAFAEFAAEGLASGFPSLRDQATPATTEPGAPAAPTPPPPGPPIAVPALIRSDMESTLG